MIGLLLLFGYIAVTSSSELYCWYKDGNMYDIDMYLVGVHDGAASINVLNIDVDPQCGSDTTVNFNLLPDAEEYVRYLYLRYNCYNDLNEIIENPHGFSRTRDERKQGQKIFNITQDCNHCVFYGCIIYRSSKDMFRKFIEGISNDTTRKTCSCAAPFNPLPKISFDASTRLITEISRTIISDYTQEFSLSPTSIASDETSTSSSSDETSTSSSSDETSTSSSSDETSTSSSVIQPTQSIHSITTSNTPIVSNTPSDQTGTDEHIYIIISAIAVVITLTVILLVVGIICCIVYNTSNTYKRQTTDYSHRQYDYKFDLDIHYEKSTGPDTISITSSVMTVFAGYSAADEQDNKSTITTTCNELQNDNIPLPLNTPLPLISTTTQKAPPIDDNIKQFSCTNPIKLTQFKDNIDSYIHTKTATPQSNAAINTTDGYIHTNIATPQSKADDKNDTSYVPLPEYVRIPMNNSENPIFNNKNDDYVVINY